MKTIITFCSIWTFFEYDWKMGPGPKIKRSQLRSAPLFQKPPIIVSDHFLTLELFSSAPPKDGKNQLDFQIQNFMLNLLKKVHKKVKYSRSWPSSYWGVCSFYLF